MAEPVSILIPAYNEAFFAEALESALAQRYADFEVVVCDDSPGDAKASGGTSRGASPRRARTW